MIRTSTANFLGAADAADGPLLQNAQQLDLHRETRLSDFVQENRALIRNLKQSLLVRRGAGKRAAHIAEQFAFKQTFR